MNIGRLRAARPLSGALALLWATTCLSGCGGGRASADFPSQDEVKALSLKPAPPLQGEPGTITIPQWTLLGPFPDQGHDPLWQGDDPMGRILLSGAPARAGQIQVTQGQMCLAREMAHFHTHHKAMPTRHLRRFMAARCRMNHLSVGWSTLTGTADPGMTTEALMTQWKASLEQMANEVSSGVQAGVALRRHNDQVAVVLTYAKPEVKLTRADAQPDASGQLIFEGEVLTSTESLQGAVTQGDFDYAECTSAHLQLPQFRFTCTVRKTDPQAWFSLSLFPPKRLLGSSAMKALAWPAGQAPTVYRRPDRLKQAPTELSPQGLAQAVNMVRGTAQRSPLTFEANQSRTASALAPHYFGDSADRDTVTDRVALGLMAGWDVQGRLTRGRFQSYGTAGLSVKALIDEMLDDPGARRTLLDPDVQRVAVGAVIDADKRYVGSLFTTYHEVPGPDALKAMATRIQKRINGQRKAKGLPPMERLTQLENNAYATRQALQKGALAPDEALDEALKMAVQTLNTSVRGTILTTNRPETLDLDPALLSAPNLKLGILVGHHQADGEPWSSYLVVMVFPASVQGAVASTRP